MAAIHRTSPLITTVIPTYRRPSRLKKAIFSALDQTYANIQVSIYDNHSQDETQEIVEKIAKKDPRVKYHCQSQTINAPANFRSGLCAVKTPFFSILSDDDILAPTCYETGLRLFDRYPKAMVFLGSTIDCSPTGKIISAKALQWDREYFEPPAGVFEVIQKYFNWTGALFRKEVLDTIQIDPALKPIDYDFVLRCAAKFPVAISKKPCALFIIHPHSYSSSSGLKLFWPSWLKIAQNMTALLPEPTVQQQIQILLRNQLKNNLFRLVIHQISQKKFDAADSALEVYEKEFSDQKRLPVLKNCLRVFRKHSYLLPMLRFALKIYRNRHVIIQMRFGKLARSLCYQKNDSSR